jgi:hypothetical protein
MKLTLPLHSLATFNSFAKPMLKIKTPVILGFI